MAEWGGSLGERRGGKEELVIVMVSRERDTRLGDDNRSLEPLVAAARYHGRSLARPASSTGTERR